MWISRSSRNMLYCTGIMRQLASTVEASTGLHRKPWHQTIWHVQIVQINVVSCVCGAAQQEKINNTYTEYCTANIYPYNIAKCQAVEKAKYSPLII